MSTDKRELKDQLNILFDDIDEPAEEAEEAVAKTSGIVASEKGIVEAEDLEFTRPIVINAAPEADEDDILKNDFYAEEDDSVRLAYQEADSEFSDGIPDDAFEEPVLNRNNDREYDVYGDVSIPEVSQEERIRLNESAKAAVPSRNDVPHEDFFLDGDDYDEGADNEAEADDYYVSPHREPLRLEKRRDLPSDEEIRKESIRFWIFTACIALIVAASVLFILNRRGFLELPFGKTTAAPTTTQPATAVTTSATTEEKTTLPTTQSTTETTTTEEPTTETTTEPTTEPTTESSAAADGPNAVLNNYSNLFVITNTHTANLRAGASTDTKIIGTLDENYGGEVLEIQGDWYHVKTGGLEGYLHKDYVLTGADAQAIAVANARQRVKVIASVNIRLEANTTSNVIEIAKEGAVYDFLEDAGDFYKIRYNASTDAYVSKDFSSLSYYIDEALPHYE